MWDNLCCSGRLTVITCPFNLIFFLYSKLWAFKSIQNFLKRFVLRLGHKELNKHRTNQCIHRKEQHETADADELVHRLLILQYNKCKDPRKTQAKGVNYATNLCGAKERDGQAQITNLHHHFATSLSSHSTIILPSAVRSLTRSSPGTAASTHQS